MVHNFVYVASKMGSWFLIYWFIMGFLRMGREKEIGQYLGGLFRIELHVAVLVLNYIVAIETDISKRLSLLARLLNPSSSSSYLLLSSACYLLLLLLANDDYIGSL